MSHWIASVISSSPRQEGLRSRTASWIAGVNMYTPTSARSLFGCLRLLLQADDLAALVQLGHAEVARVRHLGQHDLRVRPGGAELLAPAG